MLRCRAWTKEEFFSLEDLMDRNYTEVNDSTAIDETEAFMQDHPDAKNLPAYVTTSSLKLLTKMIAQRVGAVLAEYGDLTPYDQTFVNNALEYCEEAIRRIENGVYKSEKFRHTRDAENSIPIMHAHFNSHAADLAYHLINFQPPEKKREFAYLAQIYYKEAIRLADQCGDFEHSANQFANLSRAEYMISAHYQGEERLRWQIQSAKTCLKGAIKMLPFNKTSAMYCYSYAAESKYIAGVHAGKIGEQDKGQSLIRQSLRHMKDAISICEQEILSCPDKNEAEKLCEWRAIKHYKAGKFADFIYSHTRFREDARIAHDFYEEFVQTTKFKDTKEYQDATMALAKLENMMRPPNHEPSRSFVKEERRTENKLRDEITKGIEKALGFD